MTHIEIAQEMVGGSLDPSLQEYLDEIADFCRMVGGNLVSRQVIALAIQQWKDKHPARSPRI